MLNDTFTLMHQHMHTVLIIIYVDLLERILVHQSNHTYRSLNGDNSVMKRHYNYQLNSIHQRGERIVCKRTLITNAFHRMYHPMHTSELYRQRQTVIGFPNIAERQSEHHSAIPVAPMFVGGNGRVVPIVPRGSKFDFIHHSLVLIS
jgi:hypothetical protein